MLNKHQTFSIKQILIQPFGLKLVVQEELNQTFSLKLSVCTGSTSIWLKEPALCILFHLLTKVHVAFFSL